MFFVQKAVMKTFKIFSSTKFLILILSWREKQLTKLFTKTQLKLKILALFSTPYPTLTQKELGQNAIPRMKINMASDASFSNFLNLAH